MNVSVVDKVKVTEKLNNTKPWFNGAKKFFSVKILPPKRK